jgi:hypothetical protein
MQKTILRSFFRYFLLFSIVLFNIFSECLDMGTSAPSPPPGENTLWSLTTWKIVLSVFLTDLWKLAPVYLPVSVTAAGFLIGGPVLLEDWGWKRADFLIPGEYSYSGAEPPSIEEPSVIWHAYDAVRNWARYVSAIVGLGAGIGLFAKFFLPVSTGWSILSDLALLVFSVMATAVAAVGWIIVFSFLQQYVFGQLSSSG